MTKALIFGTGAVGGVYGYILHKAGLSVTAVCRTNYSAVKEKGMLIRSNLWGNCHYKPTVVKTVHESRAHGPFDWIIVASKAFPGTAEMIRDAVAVGKSAIILAQNGIGIEEDYAKLYPENAIISGVVYLPVTQVEPGVIEMGELERFEIGTYPATAPANVKTRAQELSNIWKAGNASAPVFDDVQRVRWLKLAVNASWNPVTALTLCDDANFIRSSTASLAMIKNIMRDIGKVATAAGYGGVITDEWIERDLQRPTRRLKTGGKELSMLTDVKVGRPIEVEAILGNPLRVAHKYGVETPYLKLLYTLAKARNYELAPDARWMSIARH